MPFKLRVEEGDWVEEPPPLPLPNVPDTLWLGERVNAEVGEAPRPVPLPLTLLLLTTLLDTVGVKEGL